MPGAPLLGVYDFSYAPYALGDALTWTMNLNVAAAEAGCDAIDQVLVIDPRKPGNRYQAFVNPHNYVGTIDALLPAFLCSPKLRSLKLLRDKPTFNRLLLAAAGRPMWPSLLRHLLRRLDFISHRRINAHYRAHGTLPWLGAPRGFEGWAAAFRRRHCPGRFLVAVNIRQGALGASPANLHRDSPAGEWLTFLREAAARQPDVAFAVLGAYSEHSRELWRLPNVLVPRAMGFGLGHELALIHGADLFMGSSSGFAGMATFCNKPYAITNVQHQWSRYIGVPVGARHFPFGAANQILSWERERAGALLGFLEELRGRAS
jgi:hypothetical protein